MNIGWNFDNSYAQLPKSFYTNLSPTSVSAPQLVILNESLASSLGLDVTTLQSHEGIEVLAGNRKPEGALPLAQAYAGHQFGNFTMLGDGRAALGPMLREYIISEAMHALGIATTRSLAVVTTGEPVFRETELSGAILTRVASSHLRVGTFQYAAHWGTTQELKTLADYAIQRHFPKISNRENRYLALFQEVMKRQAELIAKWQLVGFIHGVMNTDNMTISGETIDYGPCAFMDTYDPTTVFSSIDYHGRYAYGNQPQIGMWNLARFAESLLPLLHDDEKQAIKRAEEALSDYNSLFEHAWLAGMRAKLGLLNEEADDEILVKNLLQIMQQYRADYTNTFRALTMDHMQEYEFFDSRDFRQWHQQWQARLARQPDSNDASHQLMRQSNPAVIPRNHRVEEALEAAVEQENDSVMRRFLSVLSHPYEYTPQQAVYAALPEKQDESYRTFCGT